MVKPDWDALAKEYRRSNKYWDNNISRYVEDAFLAGVRAGMQKAAEIAKTQAAMGHDPSRVIMYAIKAAMPEG